MINQKIKKIGILTLIYVLLNTIWGVVSSLRFKLSFFENYFEGILVGVIVAFIGFGIMSFFSDLKFENKISTYFTILFVTTLHFISFIWIFNIYDLNTFQNIDYVLVPIAKILIITLTLFFGSFADDS